LGVLDPLGRGDGGLSKNLWGRYRPVRCRANDGFVLELELELGPDSRGGVVMTGMETLADEAGRDGFRTLDGPASSKLTHSIDELWDPVYQLLLLLRIRASSPKYSVPPYRLSQAREYMSPEVSSQG
jgi:hypothetical protein